MTICEGARKTKSENINVNGTLNLRQSNIIYALSAVTTKDNAKGREGKGREGKYPNRHYETNGVNPAQCFRPFVIAV